MTRFYFALRASSLLAFYSGTCCNHSTDPFSWLCSFALCLCVNNLLLSSSHLWHCGITAIVCTFFLTRVFCNFTSNKAMAICMFLLPVCQICQYFWCCTSFRKLSYNVCSSPFINFPLTTLVPTLSTIFPPGLHFDPVLSTCKLVVALFLHYVLCIDIYIHMSYICFLYWCYGL